MKWGVRHERDDYISSGRSAQIKYKAAKTRMKKAKSGSSKESYQNAKSSYKRIKADTAWDRKRNYTSNDKDWDQAKYGKRGQAKIERRIREKGMSRSQARRIEFGKQFVLGYAATDILTGGFLHKTTIWMGKQTVKTILKSSAARNAAKQAAKATIRIAQNPYYNPIDAAYKILN